MQRTTIIRAFTRTRTIKIVGILVMVGIFFINPTFAAETTDPTLEMFKETLEIFLGLCSRLWIMLAILAGKLMTNDFVYGAFIHMDIYLWKIWNIIKNFANFALIGLVLVSIIKSFFGKEALDVKKTITNMLVAGVLIQASRFLVGALIDISTVATAAVSSFPTSFLRSDATLRGKIDTTIKSFRAQRVFVDLNTEDVTKIVEIGNASNISNPTVSDSPRESVLPSYNSVSGPFIYLGMGVFDFHKYLTAQDATDLSKLTLGLALRFFMIFLFTLGLLFLVVANIMRIGLLWLFIVGSPFLILVQFFKLGEGSGNDGLGKIFKFSNLLVIAFKPVIFVAGISLMFIVITSMQSSMTSSEATRENNLNGVTLGKDGEDISTLTVDQVTTISVNQKDLLGKDVLDEGQNIFSELIMLFLMLFLMRRFIKMSLTIGGGPIEDTMKKLTGRAEDMAKSAPILPIIGGGTSLNAANFFRKEQFKNITAGFGMDKYGKFVDAEAAFEGKVNSYLGMKQGWTDKDYRDLGNIADKKGGDFLGESRKIAAQREGGLSLSDSKWIALYETWMKKQTSVDLQGMGFVQGMKFESFEQFFKDNNKNRKVLYKQLGGDAASFGSENFDGADNIPYDKLVSRSFYRKDDPAANSESTPPDNTGDGEEATTSGQ